MKYLGFDLGTKTLGISISDSKGIIALPLTTLRYNNENYEILLIEIEEIITENNITIFCVFSFSFPFSLFSNNSGFFTKSQIPTKIIGINKSPINTHAFQYSNVPAGINKSKETIITPNRNFIIPLIANFIIFLHYYSITFTFAEYHTFPFGDSKSICKI